MDTCTLHRGRAPLLISLPHNGTALPEALRPRLTDSALRLADTDWHVDRLYAFARDLGASILVPRFSRYVVDLNRPSDNQPMYAGANNTELCPTRFFSGEMLYREGQAPGEAEVRERVAAYWQPYHDALRAELDRLRAAHGHAVLFDGHSIKSELPWLFDGKLPDLNLGTAGGAACAPALRDALLRHGLDGLQAYPAAPVEPAAPSTDRARFLGVPVLATGFAPRAGRGDDAPHVASPEARACRDAFAALLGPLAQLAASAGNLERLGVEYRRTERRAKALENVLLPEPELMKQYVGNPAEKLRNLMNPSAPVMSGVVQNQDSYMKGKITQRYFYDRVRPRLQRAMEEFYQLTGRRYEMVESYGMDEAEYAIVCMGSMAETAAVTCDYLRQETGLKVGVVHVTCFRPFPGPEIVQALSRCRAITVLERMDNPMGQSNPLTAEIKAAFADALVDGPGYPRIHRIPVIFSGSAGLGSRDVRPGDLIAAVKNMVEGGRRYFVLGIKHELALDASFDPDVRPKGAFSMRGHSVGGYGSVTTNKVIATIVGDLFNLYVQAYPKYGSEKKGLPTTYYLTAADQPIRTHCELNFVEFVPLNDVNAFNLGNPLLGLQPGGAVFLNRGTRKRARSGRTSPNMRGGSSAASSCASSISTPPPSPKK